MIYNRTTWENSPSTSTPINAQNLNKIEQGITDAANEINVISHIVNVGTEIEEDSRVNLLHSKNLFDKNNTSLYVNGWIQGTTMRLNTSNTSRLFYLPCKPNTTYTMSRSVLASSFRITTYDSTPFPTPTSSNVDYTVATTIENNTATSITITTGANAKYLVVQYGINTDTNLQESLATIQIEYGETATSYEPYIQNQMVVDNEKFTDTINVGTSINDKSRVNIIHSKNLLPNNGSTTTTNGITFTKNSDGSITINGTSTGRADLYIFDGTTNNSYLKIKKGTYSFDRRNLTNGKIFFAFREKTAGTTYETLTNNSALELMATQDCYFYRVMLGIESGNTINNLTIYPMLNEGSEALPYEPYIQNQIVVDDETFTDTIKVSNEIDGKSKVNVIHSRNLFDKNNVNALNAYFVDGTNNITADTSGNNKTIYIPCKPNTTYTIQKTASPSNRAIGYTTTTPAVGVAVQGATNISANTTTGSITTGNNARYLVIRVWSGSQDTITYEQMLASVQIEEGDTATSYEPYIQNQIVVDNEKFTDTLKVGTNVDGKSRVNIIHSRNLCTGNNNNAIIAKLESGTYTFSLKSSINGGFTLKKNNSSGDNIAPLKPITTGINSTTFTISETTNVFLNGYSTTSGTGFADGTSEWMLNKGSTALPYEPFTTNEINIDNEKYTDTLNVGASLDSRSRVNIIRQVNNILPKGTIYTLSTGSVSLNFKVPKANTQYTMKTNLPATDGLALVFFGSGADAQVSSDANGVWVGSPRTMTSDANGYVTIAFRYLSNFSNIKLGDYWYTIAEGTLGVDYIAPSINVDGEEIYQKPVVLWTNPSPSSAFAQQNITLNDAIENYSYYEVIYRANKDSSMCGSMKMPIDVNMKMETNQGFAFLRLCTARSGTSMGFSTCVYYSSYGSATTATQNDCIIPVMVLGYK